MNPLEELRRQLGILGCEILTLQADMYDHYKEYREKYEALNRRFDELHQKIEEAMDE